MSIARVQWCMVEAGVQVRCNLLLVLFSCVRQKAVVRILDIRRGCPSPPAFLPLDQGLTPSMRSAMGEHTSRSSVT